jgi:hypothetical protein
MDVDELFFVVLYANKITEFLDFVHHLEFPTEQCFRNWICFHPQVKMRGALSVRAEN